MKSPPLEKQEQEVELKLALPGEQASQLALRLARSASLARRRPSHLHLHNIYCDTPEQLLRRARWALRLRSIGEGDAARWVQTLKTNPQGNAALSQRGEWEVELAQAALSREALQATPWAQFDPQGRIFEALTPRFETEFERTLWTVRKRDGAVVEVALDQGWIRCGDRSEPIFELELELLHGPVDALFGLASEFASRIGTLPQPLSKAQRGYLLAQGAANQPLRAEPPVLPVDLTLAQAARRLLGEAFAHFTSNLCRLHGSDDPEIVHQARVGWRRFKSLCRQFGGVSAIDAPPDWQALQPLLSALGQLRDLDVARSETLPALASAWTDGDAPRAAAWQALMQSLQHAAQTQRAAVLRALDEPAAGLALLAGARWLSAEWAEGDAAKDQRALRPWARQRVARLHRRLRAASAQLVELDMQHRARIVAKRLRYCLEALRPLVNPRRARRWYRQALGLQTRLGATRDLARAIALARELGADAALVEFLRGVALGRTTPR